MLNYTKHKPGAPARFGVNLLGGGAFRNLLRLLHSLHSTDLSSELRWNYQKSGLCQDMSRIQHRPMKPDTIMNRVKNFEIVAWTSPFVLMMTAAALSMSRLPASITMAELGV